MFKMKSEKLIKNLINEIKKEVEKKRLNDEITLTKEKIKKLRETDTIKVSVMSYSDGKNHIEFFSKEGYFIFDFWVNEVITKTSVQLETSNIKIKKLLLSVLRSNLKEKQQQLNELD